MVTRYARYLNDNKKNYEFIFKFQHDERTKRRKKNICDNSICDKLILVICFSLICFCF